ncbi:MAG: hypothetical protein ACRCSU_04965 [Paracoccaceae bacterium]
MALNGADPLVAGMGAGRIRLPFVRASIATQVAGAEASLWRGTGGVQAQGAIPTTAAVCNAATPGALPLAARAGAQERAISKITLHQPTLGQSLLTEDRLMHMGGLNGTLTTAQTVGIDLGANLANSNLAERIGAPDYSEIEWYVEWYTATGATIATPTVGVTFHDDTTATVNIWNLGTTALPASVAASRRYKLSPVNGKFIKAVSTLQLSVSTGTAGNFGVTAVRTLAECECRVINARQDFDWTQINLPLIRDNACVTSAVACATTSTGAITGSIYQAVA